MTSTVLSQVRSLRLPQLSPATRIAAGLIALIISSMLLIDIGVGLVPDSQAALQQARKRSAENLGILVAELAVSPDRTALARGVSAALARRDDIRSLALRRADGEILFQNGEHVRHWVPPPSGGSTLDHMRLSLRDADGPWADLEISFVPAHSGAVQRFFADPLVRLLCALGIGGFVLFALYLRRVLSYLDPSAVIPDRVRAAFDAFSEGVLVLDTKGRIMLANRAFVDWVGEAAEALQGRAAHDLRSLRHMHKGTPQDFPWMQAMAHTRSLTGDMMELRPAERDARKVVVNCAPIADGRKGARGCIVTFDDVSALEQVNQSLLQALGDLEASRAQIELQNAELKKLATRDPLTGCLNRRAFFEAAAALLEESRTKGAPLHCIMTDIDHFKSFNDRYGHAVGDQVLQSVSKQLSAGLRETDLLCRYGGEEFCIFLPGTSTEVAMTIAERLRVDVESQAGPGVRSEHALKVTSSFGLALLVPELQAPGDLVDRADIALYQAKRTGRNRVVLWQPGLEPENKGGSAGH
ncbi:MAG: diguanylate cyclase [Burkholderiales bacterium]|nr:diguanylate cyclase [Burkholderiales bacterium]